MKERPILFNAPMVRALLNDSKTQTRRIIKPEPQMVTDKTIAPWAGDPSVLMRLLEQSGKCCPYGVPGDRLWVREAWRVIDAADCFAPREVTSASRVWFESDLPHQPGFGRYRPSMFMPRWASRITLEIVSVRVERLQDISEADAIAEGIPASASEPCDHPRQSCADVGCWGPTAKGRYGYLWESINDPGSWDVNPWVWVVEFKKVAL